MTVIVPPAVFFAGPPSSLISRPAAAGRRDGRTRQGTGWIDTNRLSQIIRLGSYHQRVK